MLFSAKTFFSDMADKTIDMIGLGVSHTDLIFRLAEAGAQVTVCDRRAENQLDGTLLARMKASGIKTNLGPDYLDHLSGEIIFRTPGFPYLTPQLIAAKNRGQTVTSEMEVFLSLCPCPIYGVTGSDGKTTTSSLIAAMLRRTGKAVHLGGNIGTPLLPILDKISENDLCVVELSSFQLISMRQSPDISVITNLSPNHLDIHKNMEEYIAAKCNILDHQDAFSRAILPMDNPLAAALSDRVRGSLTRFSSFAPVENGTWMDEHGDIFHSISGRSVRLFNRQEVRLPGMHNIENLLAAAAACWGRVSPRDIAAVATSFTGVEHRIEFVDHIDGVRWYNDSIATSPTRMIAGLMSFDQKLIVIAGGYDKQIPFDPLVQPLLDHCKILILTGATADKIEAAVTGHPHFSQSGLEIIRADDLPNAVKKARKSAQEGDVVMLSPACASFDAYQNFEVRGLHFKELVSDLKKGGAPC